jgi:hypothetical protein
MALAFLPDNLRLQTMILATGWLAAQGSAIQTEQIYYFSEESPTTTAAPLY